MHRKPLMMHLKLTNDCNVNVDRRSWRTWVMNAEELISTFPRLYHMAHVNAWPGIKRHGLLSTSALLDLFEVTGPGRKALEANRRNDSITVHHKRYGEAVIRDNKPMDDAGLMRALTDMTPEEWYRTLNRKVFFWPTEERLNRLLMARFNRPYNHCVITVNTRRLVRDYHDKVWLCPINSGATAKPMPQPRGTETFRRICDYPFNDWSRKRRSCIKAVAELAVDYSVPNIRDYVEAVSVRNSTGVVHTLSR